MSRTTLWMAAAVVVSAGAAEAAQSGAEYPVRPIRVVVPYAAGGATDIVARILGPKLYERMGQPIVVDNRAGAAGNLAVELVAQAQPDGYTLFVGNISTNSINPILFKSKAGVDAGRNLAGIGSLNWNGLFAPRKTPGAVIEKLHKASVAVMTEPEMQDFMAKRAIPVAVSASPAEFDAYVRSERDRWAKIVSDNNVKID